LPLADSRCRRRDDAADCRRHTAAAFDFAIFAAIAYGFSPAAAAC